MSALFEQARDEKIDSPFRDLAPSIGGMLHVRARGAGLVYRVAVNRRQARVVLTNTVGKWQGGAQGAGGKAGRDGRRFQDRRLAGDA